MKPSKNTQKKENKCVDFPFPLYIYNKCKGHVNENLYIFN